MAKSTHKRKNYYLIRAAQRDRCYLCGVEVQGHSWNNRLRDPTLDHILPKIAGGTLQPPNVAMACNKCNGAKYHRMPRPCEVFFGQIIAEMIGYPPAVYRPPVPDNPTPQRWSPSNDNFESALAVALREAGYG